MKQLFTLLLGICTVFTYAQITGYEAQKSDTAQAQVAPGVNQNVNMKIEQGEAYFPGGNDSLFRLIYSRLEFSDEAIEANANGEILLSFFVNFDGKVRDVSILEGIGYGIDKSVADIIKELIFEPARMNDTAFRSQVFYTVPVDVRRRTR